MLHRNDPDGLIVIAQPAHAWISGQLARAWGNAQFGQVVPWEEVCLAAEQHDIGMAAWETAPTLNPHTGRSHLILFGLLLGVVLALKVPATAITRSPAILFWLGVSLLYAGMALRLYAIVVLGAFFTTTLAVAPEQTVIDTGPYRHIRHPSYSGLLLILLGFGLSLTNWLSPLVIMGCALIGFAYSIQVEEQVLQEQLGQQYQEYMRRTNRLIPFVL